MGKKKSSKESNIPQKEAMMRINYLYQAALTVSSGTPNLSRYYIHVMKSISQKLVLKMDPSIKRTVCKSCDALLIPGVTCTNRIRAKREKHLVVKCLNCGALKRFLARKDYKLWSEKPENISKDSIEQS